jgi:geranylgeranylglycerol-phosphate geranylgeranyltransferase
MIISFIKMARPINVLLSIITVIISAFILKQELCSYLVIITSLIVAGFTIFSNILNDIFDIKTDKLNCPQKPLITGEISINKAFILSFIILILSLCLLFQLNSYSSKLVIYIIFPIIITYTPVFKSVPLFGNTLIGITLGLVFLFTEASLTNKIELLWFPALLATHLTILRELLKDIEDYSGDYKTKIYTFPVYFGINNSIKLFFILTFLLLFWAGFLPFWTHLNSFYLLTFWGLFSPWIFYILFLLFSVKSNNYSRISSLLKIATIVGLVVIITLR